MRTSPATFVFGGNSEAYDAKTEEALVLFPLLSWYHASWDSEPDLPPGMQTWGAPSIRVCSRDVIRKMLWTPACSALPKNGKAGTCAQNAFFMDVGRTWHEVMKSRAVHTSI